MPRQNRRRAASSAREPAAASTVGERRDEWRGEVYVVRGVTSHGAAKEYRCPGCDQVIRVGQPHLVVWPEFDDDADDRRHWHATCWTARERRAPGRGRAPRY
ncbi:MAG TPA: hypothetical protein VGN35_04240 [Jatrophihabitantaceae bacterium]|nr:hypothetical protein [Jatrophihabitantaceae bacterium]